MASKPKTMTSGAMLKSRMVAARPTISMQIPDVMEHAKRWLIDTHFGGTKSWEAAHVAGATDDGHGLENIGAIYIGQKFTEGKPTQYLCVVVEVYEKADEDALRVKIPKAIEIDGEKVLTDVIIGHRVAPQATMAGDSCGFNNPAAGGFETGQITCFTSVKFNGEEFLSFLSNSHVFGKIAGRVIGDDVLAPGGAVLGFLFDDGPTGMDCAVATVKTGASIDGDSHKEFEYKGVARQAVVGDRVKVLGGPAPKKTRTGKVVVTGIDKTVGYKTGPRVIRNLFQIRSDDGRPLTIGGDSGALILSEGNEMLGLLIGADTDAAGQPIDTSVAHQITEVQTALSLGDFLAAS